MLANVDKVSSVNTVDKIASDSPERSVDKALLTLKLNKKRLQTEGVIKRIRDRNTGSRKKSEERKNKIVSSIKRKISSLGKTKNHKITKTGIIISSSAFRVEIHKKHINIYENKKPNEIFASQIREIDDRLTEGEISHKDIEFISYYIY